MASDKEIIRQLTERVEELVEANEMLTTRLAEVDQLDAIKLAAKNTTLKKKVSNLTDQLKATGGAAPVNIRGFLLGHTDPYGMGAVRAYRTCGGRSTQHDALPFVLPDKDAATKTAIKSYIVRAEGAGDKDRAEAARKKLAAIS